MAKSLRITNFTGAAKDRSPETAALIRFD